MSTTTKRIQTLDVALSPEPGSLAKIYNGFREVGVNVIASWGYEMGPGEAQAHFYAADIEKAKTTLTKMGFKPQINNACWIEGDDRVGAYAEVLTKLAKANVNVDATDAFAIGDRFAAVLFTQPKQWAALCKALSL